MRRYDEIFRLLLVELRLRRAIAINLVIAWRIMLMTLLGREAPELPAEVLFSDIEIRTLRAYAKKKE